MLYKALRSAGGIRRLLRLLRKGKKCDAEKDKSMFDCNKCKLAT